MCGGHINILGLELRPDSLSREDKKYTCQGLYENTMKSWKHLEVKPKVREKQYFGG